MTAITLHADYALGLTEFNRDGLELFIHKDGSVHADLNAIARMCDVSQGAIYRKVVTSADSKTPYITHKKVTAGGTQPIHLYPVSVVMACAQKYNPKLSKKFMEMGAMVYLYQLAGYKTKVELPTKAAQSEAELFRMAGEAMIELGNIKDKLSHAPGIAAKLQATPVSGYAMIEGKVDMYKIQDLLAMLGVIVDPKMYATISRALNSALVSDGSIVRAMVEGHMVYPLSALATLRTLVS